MIRAFRDEMKRIGDKVTGRDFDSARAAPNISLLHKEEALLTDAAAKVMNAGIPKEKIYERGQLTALERINILTGAIEGSFLPLNTLYDPNANEEGSVGVFTGLARVGSTWTVVVASDNRVLAGAWLPGQADKIFRAQDIAEKLHLPLVWLSQCSGVKLTMQEYLYAGRNSGGAIFFRNAALLRQGIPVAVAVFGTNPAGGGYHAISPGIIFMHKDANMAVGGAAILSGMSPKGGFNNIAVEQIARAVFYSPDTPAPGSAQLHEKRTGFVYGVYPTEEEVIHALRLYVESLPRWGNPDYLRILKDAPKPIFDAKDLDFLIPMDQRQSYSIEMVIGRLVDNSVHMEFRPDYGPEVYCGLVCIDGFLTGLIANRQGILPQDYPKYSKQRGIGGKLYREGLIKMSEFVAFAGHDKLPLIWLQDTTGIDVGDEAEEAELLGLGMTLISAIEDVSIPMCTVVLRKGHAASHYILGGPQATRNNVLTLGTPAAEICVMHGETAAIAAYSARAKKAYVDRKPMEPIVDQMNALALKYHEESRPLACARRGYVDEIIRFTQLRSYLSAFCASYYQNQQALCPPHHMILPRSIMG